MVLPPVKMLMQILMRVRMQILTCVVMFYMSLHSGINQMRIWTGLCDSGLIVRNYM